MPRKIFLKKYTGIMHEVKSSDYPKLKVNSFVFFNGLKQNAGMTLA